MKVLFVRHAQSTNNVVQASIQKRLGVGATGLQQAQVCWDPRTDLSH